jgi:hypothetical protein
VKDQQLSEKLLNEAKKKGQLKEANFAWKLIKDTY